MQFKGFDNWTTQIRKGYLDLCILTLVNSRHRVYGFEILELMASADLPIKEGTLYPLLNRMAADGLLESKWETEQLKGHPRKFYSLTRNGEKHLTEMIAEFERMHGIFKKLKKT